MSSPGDIHPAVDSAVDEQSPLLRHDRPRPQDNGSIEQHQELESHNTGQDEVPLAEEPSTAKLILICASLWMGVFLAALDSTIVATLAAPISASFNSFTLLSWLATAYLVANAGIQPLSGKLTDIFGRRSGLILSNIFFGTGTLICGLAKDEWVIIFGRIIAGMGGGCLNTISTFVLSDLLPLRKRAVFQGYGNICFGLGAGLGGVFGGWINDVWDWRWAFLIQVPAVAVSGVIVAFTINIPVKDTEQSRLKRVDFLGSFTLVLSLVLFLIGLNSGGNIVPWTHPLVYVSLPLAGIALVAFLYVEDKIAVEPIIPVRLLLHRTVGAACLTNWFATMAIFSVIYYGPIFFQVKGLSATGAGARLVPSSVGISVGSLGTGIIMKATGKYYVLNVVLEGLMVIAAVLITLFLNFDVQVWPPFIMFFLAGMGYGGMLTVTLLALISAVDHKYQAVITSASYAFRSTGSTIGITISSAVFQNVLKMRLWQTFGNRKNAAEIIARIRDSIKEIDRLPPGWKDGVLRAYMDALQSVWITALGMVVLAAAAGFFMREHTLYTNLARSK